MEGTTESFSVEMVEQITIHSADIQVKKQL